MRVLYCVLNWGLGHATRSIPVIQALLRAGAEVDIASDGAALQFLKASFPDHTFYELPGYDVRYRSKHSLINAITQAPAVLKAIAREREVVDGLVKRGTYDRIISDNRYGCWHHNLPSILITHQLGKLSNNPVSATAARALIAKWTRPFAEIWIPDLPDRRLSGRLSQSDDPRVKFIGLLTDVRDNKIVDQDIYVAAILSGPEPQRSRFEQELYPQLIALNKHCVMVCGCVADEVVTSHERQLTIHNFLPRAGIHDILNRAQVIVCRSGYSSLMDLKVLGKKAILVATPGQPEQMYLADRLGKLHQFYEWDQMQVGLEQGIALLQGMAAPAIQDPRSDLLTKAIASCHPVDDNTF